MEAIVEMFGALIAVAFQLFARVVKLAVHVLALLLEFLFLATTQGISTAKKQYQKRQSERKQATELATAIKAANTKTDNAPQVIRATRQAKMIIVGSLRVAVIAVIFALNVWEDNRRKQIAATNALIENLADGFATEIKDGKGDALQSNFLKDRDAWNQPVGPKRGTFYFTWICGCG